HIACASVKFSALMAELLTNIKVIDNNIDTINEIKSKLPLKSENTLKALNVTPKTKKKSNTKKK
ncbi:MAG TPA: hypothetical protein VIK29_04830, partial [Paludibacter sp.]